MTAHKKRKFEIDDRDLWVRCEVAVGLWLESTNNAGVEWTSGRPQVAENRRSQSFSELSGPPLIKIGGEDVRKPDFKIVDQDGRTHWWEVKQRAAAWRDEADGTSCFWVAQDALDDYVRAATDTESASDVTIIVYEGNYLSGRWYKADVLHLARVARSREFVFRDEETGDQTSIIAALWPVHEMTELLGETAPSLRTSAEHLRVPVEGETTRPKSGFSRLGEPGDPDAQLELDQLRRTIGMSAYPRYSVLYAHRKLDDPSELRLVFQLLDYGVRVFLITDSTAWSDYYSSESGRLSALRESSILEVSVVDCVDDAAAGVLAIDGVPTKKGTGPSFTNLWSLAEKFGSINTRQYEIVHGVSKSGQISPETPIVVTASAGSGKTQTLTERIMFLLCTSTSQGAALTSGVSSNYDLRLDEIVLITFTREAAREMRERLTRSLVLRRRLCRRCSMPVLAWLSQLGTTKISTIHAFAKRLIQELGPRAGVATNFKVGKDFDRFDEILRSEVDRVYQALSDSSKEGLPEIHEVHKFVERVWESLVGNGVNVLEMNVLTRESSDTSPGFRNVKNLEWSPESCTEAWGREFAKYLVDIIESIADRYRTICREQSLIPTDQLLSIATDLISPRALPMGVFDELKVPKYLFIDEFQDTDEQQIDLALHLRIRGTRLFVVGDQKQAIYRFRGAAGDAFTLLKGKGIALHEYSLVRNFRTDGVLLDHMQLMFDRWSQNGHLELKDDDRLKPAHKLDGVGVRVEVKDLGESTDYEARQQKSLDETVKVIRSWQRESWYANDGGDKKIAVLCRTNRQAMKVKEHLSNLEPTISCEISIGGDFFRSQAVSELRVLLRALSTPHDLGAILQLLETSWGLAIYFYVDDEKNKEKNRGLWRYVSSLCDMSIWKTDLGDQELRSWGSRLQNDSSGRIPTDDLTTFSQRVKSMSDCLQTVPLFELLAEFDMIFEPHRRLSAAGLTDDQIDGYKADLDHLLMLLDEAFEDGTFSVWQALGWLDLKASTDYDEDGPTSLQRSEVSAITVHKSKGREFDAVVVPFCDSAFVSQRRTDIKVLAINGRRRVGWRWVCGRGKDGQTLDSNMDGAFERRDELETVMEETRLLYVAMTRAKRRLTLINTTGSANSSQPSKWADLL